MGSGGLVITKLPTKESSRNYISDHEEDDEEEKGERTSRRTKTKISYEEGDVDILEHAIGEISEPEERKIKDKSKEMKKSDSVSADSPVMLSDNDQDSSDNGVKSFQLLSGGKKLDVVMLFDN